MDILNGILNIFSSPKKSDPEQDGIYMFSNKRPDNSEHLCLFLYKKCNNDVLSKALPLSYNINNGNYIVIIFENGCDYLNQTTYDNIIQMIKTQKMVDIENNEWSYIKSQLPLLEKNKYLDSLQFGKYQIRQ
tara:strand:+ start:2327 stop:2722 length:396 start_codon:yes stop_codon:yes gene_type:complete